MIKNKAGGRELQKKRLLIALFVLGCIFAIAFSLYYMHYNMKNIEIDSVPEDTGEITYALDSVDESEGGSILTITGWSIKKGVSTNTYNTHIILWNDNDKVGYEREAMKQTRDDVDQNFNDDCDYKNSGFQAVYVLNYDIKPGNYEIIIEMTVEDRIYYAHTGNYVEVSDYE